jgi:hypothetical protein
MGVILPGAGTKNVVKLRNIHKTGTNYFGKLFV